MTVFTAEVILAVQLDRATFVDSLGAARRLEALAHDGHTLASLDQRLGYAPKVGYCASLIRNRPRIYQETHDAVAALYDELAGTIGPSRKTRRRYADWPPVEAWTAATIDDPAASPFSWDVTPQPKRALIAERRALVQQLHAAGLNDQQIARRTGYSSRTVLRYRDTLGLPAHTPVECNRRRGSLSAHLARICRKARARAADADQVACADGRTSLADYRIAAAIAAGVDLNQLDRNGRRVRPRRRPISRIVPTDLTVYDRPEVAA